MGGFHLLGEIPLRHGCAMPPAGRLPPGAVWTALLHTLCAHSLPPATLRLQTTPNFVILYNKEPLSTGKKGRECPIFSSFPPT